MSAHKQPIISSESSLPTTIKGDVSDVLLLTVACPECGHEHEYAELGSPIRCVRCGVDYRACADGEGASRILSVSPNELEDVPYSQRSIEIPVNRVSSIFMADPTLLTDKLLREAPLKENCKWMGKVRLLKKIGQGGMGSVYRGFDESLALDVAVKILPVSLDERASQFVERFRQEARLSARINHPNVVRTLHVDEQGELLYLVMDYVEGRTARQLVQEKGPLPLPQALQIILEASRGMLAAHTHDVIHRDIKPDNILVADDGRVLLTDLGLAKALSSGPCGANGSGGSGMLDASGTAMPVTRIGMLLGTPQYMSPEQWDIGAKIGPPSDIWSMGATLWMLLTGKPPIDENDLPTLARQVKEIPLLSIRSLRPELPEIASILLQRCLSKRPAERFVCAADFIAALEETLEVLRTGRDVLPLPKIVQEERERLARQKSLEAAAATAKQAPRAGVTSFAISAVEPQILPNLKQNSAPTAGHKWMRLGAGMVGAACLALAVGGGFWYAKNALSPEVAPAIEPALSLELRCPARVRLGEAADLNALITGVPNPDDFAVLWTKEEKAWTGPHALVSLQTDADFTVSVRDKNTSKERVRRSFKVLVDLSVRLTEQDGVKLEGGEVLRLNGEVKGGGGSEQIETRWVEAAHPSVTLSTAPQLLLPSVEVGRYTYVLQARRKDGKDSQDQSCWAGAISDKVSVEVVRFIPQEYKTALSTGMENSRLATRAISGEAAVSAWKKAIENFECALRYLADSEDARSELEQARKHLATEERYQALLAQGLKQRQSAEALPEADGVRRMSEWSEALQSYTSALALFEREEARSQATEIGKRVSELKTLLESAEKERGTFDGMIGKARHAAREAKKYLNPSVALPFWEEALTGFQELAKSFPKRADEFTLELREVRDNRDKAYLYDQFGVVPVKPQERVQEPPKKTDTSVAPTSTKAGANSVPNPTPTLAPAAKPLEKPVEKLPEPSSSSAKPKQPGRK